MAMKWFSIVIISAAILFAATVVSAQVVTIDINKATMSFVWTQATGDPADGFRSKCGNTTGVYTILTDFPDPLIRSLPVAKVIRASGTYFCVVVAFNKIGESKPSNEVNFIAGAAPSGSIVLSQPQ